MDARQQFLSQAEGMFMKYGIKSVSMDDIARKLGMSKKTLYQFIDNKADLITKIFYQHTVEEKKVIDEVQKTSPDAVQELISIAHYIFEQLRTISPQFIYDLQKYYTEIWKQMEGLHQQFTYQVIKSNLERGIKEGLYRKNINPSIVAKLYIGKSILIVDDELFPLKEYRPEHLYKELISYHIHGVASEKGLNLLAKYSKDLL